MNKYFAGAILASLLVLLVVSGCDLADESVSIRDRISRFESDLNNNRSVAYRHLHSDTDDRLQLAEGKGWDDFGFQEGATHSIAIEVRGNRATGTIFGGDFDVAGEDIEFVMKEEERDIWFILEIRIASVPVVQ